MNHFSLYFCTGHSPSCLIETVEQMPEGMTFEFIYVVGNSTKCLKWYKLKMCNDLQNIPALFIITLCIVFILTYFTVFLSFLLTGKHLKWMICCR